MPNIGDVKKLLPPFRNKTELVVFRQNTDDIIKYIKAKHEEYASDYDKIADLFDTGDIYYTCKEIWEFLKYNLPYTIETDENQTVKSPSAMLVKGASTDCKHYSLFIAGVLDALCREYNEPWTWCYRFASYNNDVNPGHVFVVVLDGNKEIWIDPVLSGFNDKSLQPKSFKDMALYSISGIGSTPVITVSKKKAEANFLYFVNNNLFSWKQLLRDNPGILFGKVKDYFNQNGFDFDHLVEIVNLPN